MMNPRTIAIKDELIKTVISFSGVAVTLGGGLIPFVLYLLGWMPSGKIILLVPFAIVIAFLIMLVWNMSRYAEEGHWYDRKYKLIHNK